MLRLRKNMPDQLEARAEGDTSALNGQSNTTLDIPMPDTSGLESLHCFDMDWWNSAQWFDTVVTNQGLLDDSMYGLFTPHDSNIQKLS
jgi:hypothetical protein